jgi:hypothetical protein
MSKTFKNGLLLLSFKTNTKVEIEDYVPVVEQRAKDKLYDKNPNLAELTVEVIDLAVVETTDANVVVVKAQVTYRVGTEDQEDEDKQT